MSARDDEIRRVVAELDIHIAEVEASVAVLKTLVADGEVPEEKDLGRVTERRPCPDLSLVPVIVRAGAV